MRITFLRLRPPKLFLEEDDGEWEGEEETSVVDPSQLVGPLKVCMRKAAESQCHGPGDSVPFGQNIGIGLGSLMLTPTNGKVT